jgi:hypothetical protein
MGGWMGGDLSRICVRFIINRGGGGRVSTEVLVFTLQAVMLIMVINVTTNFSSNWTL